MAPSVGERKSQSGIHSAAASASAFIQFNRKSALSFRMKSIRGTTNLKTATR